MKEKIFETMVKRPKATLKWLFFSISLIFHGLVIASVIVTPLLNAEGKMPGIRIYDLSLVTLGPPPTPSPPVGEPEDTRSSGGTTEPEPRKPEPSTGKEFVTPPEIPPDIRDETIFDIASSISRRGGPGVPGAPGCLDDTVIGPSILGKGDPKASQSEVLSISPVKVPKLIKRVAPQFPEIARRVHLQGVVVIQAVTDIFGRVVKVRVISGHPLFKDAAVKAVKQWVYEPYIINGNPKPVVFTVRINFQLEK